MAAAVVAAAAVVVAVAAGHVSSLLHALRFTVADQASLCDAYSV